MKTVYEAVSILIKNLKEDESYRYSWQANIAMAFVDTFREEHKHKGVHEIANIAAIRFLDLLCHSEGPNSCEHEWFVAFPMENAKTILPQHFCKKCGATK